MAVTRKRGTFEPMEPAVANAAPPLWAALEMRSWIACTDPRAVPICNVRGV